MAVFQKDMLRQLPPPAPFDGRGEDFEDWGAKVRSFLHAFDIGYAELLRDPEQATQEITEEVIRCRIVDRDDQQLALEHSARLNSLLTQLLLGPAFVLVKALYTTPGLEVWRRLHQRYKHNKGNRSISLLQAIFRVTFVDDGFEDRFMQWEADNSTWEGENNVVLPDVVKIGLLLLGTSGS
jgi:hypothetical protein